MDAARLEALRSHLAGLRTVQAQCGSMQMLAEARAIELAKENERLRREVSEAKHESSQLRWAMSRGQLAELKSKSAKAFCGSGDEGGSSPSRGAVALARERAKAEAEIRQHKSELDDARWLADDLAARLKQQAEEHKAHEAEAVREAVTRAHTAEARADKLEKELSRVMKQLRLVRATSRVHREKRERESAPLPLSGAPKGGSYALAGGSSVTVWDDRIPIGGSIDESGLIVDAYGNPVLDADGQPMRVRRDRYLINSKRSTYRVGVGGQLLDANGCTIYGADGKPLRVSDPRVPRGGSIGAGGIILDADGKAVLGDAGQPLFVTPPLVPAGGSISPSGVILDVNGKPVLGPGGEPLTVFSGQPSMASSSLAAGGGTGVTVPEGGSIGPGGVVLDANGKPVLGPDGTPLVVTDPRVPPGGYIGEGGVIFDREGAPLVNADGTLMLARVAPGGARGSAGSTGEDGGAAAIATTAAAEDAVVELERVEARAAATRARVAQLRQRQEAGELSEAEAAELTRLEGELVVLEQAVEASRALVMQAATGAEAEAAMARVAELRRRRAEGAVLSADELAEFERLEVQVARLEAARVRALRPDEVARETEATASRVEELRARQLRGEALSVEEEVRGSFSLRHWNLLHEPSPLYLPCASCPCALLTSWTPPPLAHWLTGSLAHHLTSAPAHRPSWYALRQGSHGSKRRAQPPSRAAVLVAVVVTHAALVEAAPWGMRLPLLHPPAQEGGKSGSAPARSCRQAGCSP